MKILSRKYFSLSIRLSLALFLVLLTIKSLHAASIDYEKPGIYYYTVPVGVTSLSLVLNGGGGGAGGNDQRFIGGRGGDGERIEIREFPVTAGQKYKLIVGAGGLHGTGSDITSKLIVNNGGLSDYGFGGNGGLPGVNSLSGQGGGGGGATALILITQTGLLATEELLLVAAGGGGGGGASNNYLMSGGSTFALVPRAESGGRGTIAQKRLDQLHPGVAGENSLTLTGRGGGGGGGGGGYVGGLGGRAGSSKDIETPDAIFTISRGGGSGLGYVATRLTTITRTSVNGGRGGISQIPVNSTLIDGTAGSISITELDQIAGRVFNDSNHNGIHDSGEYSTGLTTYVKLSRYTNGTCEQDILSISAVDKLGNYAIAPRNYNSPEYCLFVSNNDSMRDNSVYLPSGWQYTLTSPGLAIISIIAAENTPIVYFGLSKTQTLSGHIFNDLNFNSKYDAGEPSLQKDLFVKLAFYEDKCITPALVTSASTNNNGSYEFKNIYTGSYCIVLSDNNDPNDLNEYLPIGWKYTLGGVLSNESSIYISPNKDPVIDIGLAQTQNLSGQVARIINGQKLPITTSLFAKVSLYFNQQCLAIPIDIVAVNTISGMYLFEHLYANASYCVILSEDNHKTFIPYQPVGLNYVDGTTAQRIVPLSANADSLDNNFYLSPISGQVISSRVCNDTNYDGQCSDDEPATGLILYTKITPLLNDTCLLPALSVTPFSLSTGTTQLNDISAGAYCLILSDNTKLTDAQPYTPQDGWWYTSENKGVIKFNLISGENSTHNDFALGKTRKIKITTFLDDGANKGIAYNGVQEAGEAVLDNMQLSFKYDAINTELKVVSNAAGEYYIILPNEKLTGNLLVSAAQPLNKNLVSKSVHPVKDNSANSDYAQINFAISDYREGTSLNFGFSKKPIFGIDSFRYAMLGGVSYHRHQFKAFADGYVNFNYTQPKGVKPDIWSNELFILNDCQKIILDNLNQPITLNQNIPIKQGESLCLLTRSTVPDILNIGDTVTQQLHANYQFKSEEINPNVATQQSITLYTIINLYGDLMLLKEVDKEQAQPGEILTYTLTYRNTSNDIIHNITIHDKAANFTQYKLNSATCLAPLPQETTCDFELSGNNELIWKINGILPPSTAGKLQYQVTVDKN